eukprot:Hpha_TRINITY_DN15763_c5_g5::TRINITY_DN15763_c5_g5_i2::g.37001::m.37001
MGGPSGVSPAWMRTRSQEPPHQRRWGVQLSPTLTREETTESLRYFAAEYGRPVGRRLVDNTTARRSRAGVTGLNPQALLDTFAPAGMEDPSPQKVPQPPPPSPAAPADGASPRGGAHPPVAPECLAPAPLPVDPATGLPTYVQQQPSPPCSEQPLPPDSLPPSVYDPAMHTGYVQDEMAMEAYYMQQQYSGRHVESDSMSSQTADPYGVMNTPQYDNRVGDPMNDLVNQEEYCRTLQQQLAVARDQMTNLRSQLAQRDEHMSMHLQLMPTQQGYQQQQQPQQQQPQRVVHSAPQQQTILLQPQYVRIPSTHTLQPVSSAPVPPVLTVQQPIQVQQVPGSVSLQAVQLPDGRYAVRPPSEPCTPLGSDAMQAPSDLPQQMPPPPPQQQPPPPPPPQGTQQPPQQPQPQQQPKKQQQRQQPPAESKGQEGQPPAQEGRDSPASQPDSAPRPPQEEAEQQLQRQGSKTKRSDPQQPETKAKDSPTEHVMQPVPQPLVERVPPQQQRITLPSGATLLMPAPPANAPVPQVIKHYALAPAVPRPSAP